MILNTSIYYFWHTDQFNYFSWNARIWRDSLKILLKKQCKSAVCCTRLKCVPWSTHSDRIQQPASSRTSLQQKRRTDFIYIASYIKRTDGNYSPMNFGHIRKPFLHFSADTKQTRVLHYISVREEEKGSVFKGPHEDTECQNSGPSGDLTYSLDSEMSTYKNKSEIAPSLNLFILLILFIFSSCIKLIIK